MNSCTKVPYLTAAMLGIDLERADHGPMQDLRIVAAPGARGLSQLVLRTDIAGMPLEWIDYKEAARLYHQEQVAYTCGSLLYDALRRRQRAQRPAHDSRGQLDRRHRGAHRQPGQYAPRLCAAAEQPDAVPARRLPVHVLRAALPLARAVARSHPALQPGRHGHLDERRGGLPPLQQPEGLAHPRAGEDAADRGALHARPTRNTSSSRDGACWPTRWNICSRTSRARARCTIASSAGCPEARAVVTRPPDTAKVAPALQDAAPP